MELEGLIILLIYLAIIVVQLAGLWKVFEKADKPGWYSIIPLLNAYVLIKISDNPGWFFVLYFIPIISLYPAIKIPIDIAKRFGQGVGFGLGLIFLPFIFFPVLGFGDYEYTQPEEE